MILYYIELIILAFIQGVTEFIPVSSSAHLILISKISNFNLSSLEIDVSLHLGSLLAIIFYFWKDLININLNKALLNLILIGSIPLIILGFILFKYNLIYLLRDLKIIAWTTLIFAILLYFSDKKSSFKTINKNLSTKNIIWIGIFQGLAIIPGVSRSGIVITACRFLKFKREEAAKISFFLSIPALLGASTLSLGDMMGNKIEFNLIIVIAICSSFLFSILTIKIFLNFLKKFSLTVFVYYRIIISVLLFTVAYS